MATDKAARQKPVREKPVREKTQHERADTETRPDLLGRIAAPLADQSTSQPQPWQISSQRPAWAR